MAQTKTARLTFIATICVGSFLLFLVEPMIARMALPRLGGAPSVWNSALLVYQALLLGGYAYAHGIGRLAPRGQAMLHLLLLLVAALFLPIGLIAGDPPTRFEPGIWVLWLLFASIGPLFFMVAAQAPLIQRWYALADGGDPYPLYAASNLGSFAGLVSYPLLVEPLMPTRAQSLLWSAGYGLLILFVLACVRFLPKGGALVDDSDESKPTAGPPPGLAISLRWLLLAAVPSGLMLSTSLHLTTDIVAMPLLWVMPLGLYLLSFSIAFSARRGLAVALGAAAPLIVLMGACTAFVDGGDFPLLAAGITLLVLFVVAVALHGEMFDLRPDPAHLTRFYLIMSVGGMLGGLFCALLAPLIFNWTYEHPILLALAGLLLVRGPLFPRLFEFWGITGPGLRAGTVIVALGLVASLFGARVLMASIGSLDFKAACVVFIILLALISVGRSLLFSLCLACLMLCLGGWDRIAQSLQPGVLTRSYFGVYTVRNQGPDTRILVHGTTLHGVQSLQPGHERDTTSYYAPKSGVGLAMQALPALYGPHARVGVVGLGAGTLACYHRPGQSWRFYEIDPAMVGIARNPRDFTFLSRCLPGADIAVGDARIVLAREAAAGADLLVIDAFSSDSIPMHLLTREAFAVYASRLAPHGLLLVHISNRYLDLEPVITAAARAGGWDARMRNYLPDKAERDRHYTGSVWIALSRDPAMLARLTADRAGLKWQNPEYRPGFSAWTDDHASILPVLRIWGK